MNSYDLCANGKTAEEQRVDTDDRIYEIKSYGYSVEEVSECSVREMLKIADNCTKCKKNKKCSKEECQMRDFFQKTSMDYKVF